MEISNNIEKIAIFGGSFDPPHNGHIQIILTLIEKFQFKKILVIPTGKSPLKTHHAEGIYRKKMCELAFLPFPEVTILDIEMENKGMVPVYSIDTVRFLRCTLFPKNPLFFVMGSDCLKSIHLWKEPDALFHEAAPCIFLRKFHENYIELIHESTLSKELKKLFMEGMCSREPCFEISSTDIRSRIAMKKWVLHLLPESVYNYIIKNNLYMCTA